MDQELKKKLEKDRKEYEEGVVVPEGCFNLDFSRTLLRTLRELAEEDRIFENGLESAKHLEATMGDIMPLSFTQIAQITIHFFLKQLPTFTLPKVPSEFDRLLVNAAEFLAIFEKK